MVSKIREFFSYGIMTNVWLWFHMLFGGLFAFFCKKTEVDCWLSLIALLGITILWEVFEYFSDDVEQIYGSFKNFMYDAIGDIGGAVLIAILILC